MCNFCVTFQGRLDWIHSCIMSVDNLLTVGFVGSYGEPLNMDVLPFGHYNTMY